MLISEGYRAEQQRLHENPHYGVASIEYAPLVSMLVNKFKVTELLDYGCGKCNLAKHLEPDHKISVYGYDPAIPDLSEAPEPCQMVACIDVLEHIEPDLLDNVLDNLQSLVVELGFFTIHTGPAVKVLSDGRNAHLTQEGLEWWLPKLWERFQIQSFQRTKTGFYVVVSKHGTQ